MLSLPLKFLGTFAGIVLTAGCASIKPYLVCEFGSGKAIVQQGVMGIGVGQELKDADSLCASLKQVSSTVSTVPSTK